MATPTKAGEVGKKGTTSSSPAAPPSIGPWHIFGLFIIVAGIVILVLVVMPKFNQERDTVTGILGIAIPAFATIGGALFGVTIAYSEGKKTGAVTGQAQGEANKDQAAKEAEKRVAHELRERLVPAKLSVQNIIGPISTALPSGAGEKVFVLGDGEAAPERFEFNISDFGEATTGVEQAIRRCDEILAG